MADANPHVIAILNSEQYPAELRAKALELIAQTGLESERRRSEEDARRENLGLERTKLWLNTPFIAAFAGLLTLGATHVLSSIQSKETATLANTHVRSLEERKFQFEMIKSAFSDTKDPKQRATNLLMLIDSKILDGLDTNALKKWAENTEGPTPAFESGSATPRPGVEREYRTPASPAVTAELTDKARSTDTLRWMQHAIGELGVREIAGPDRNVRILDYARMSGLSWYTHDETPWAGLFVGFVIKQAGFDLPENPQLSHSWLSWGEAIPRPKFGALAVFSPPSPGGSGHVGFIVSEEEEAAWIGILGGNQSDAVQNQHTTARPNSINTYAS